MARAEITGKKPRVTADRAKRRKVPRTDIVEPDTDTVESATPDEPDTNTVESVTHDEPDADAIEPVTHSEPNGSDCTSAPRIRGPPVAPACFSIKTFCLAHHISESMFHKMRAAGLGPQVMQVGNRVLITFEAAANWRTEREREAATAAARETAE
jgi:hypothetical protein